MLICNTACETSHILKRFKNSDQYLSKARYYAAYLHSCKNITKSIILSGKYIH